MTSLFLVLAAVVIGLCALLALLLFVVPVDICGRIEYRHRPSGDLTTRWGALALSVSPGAVTEIRLALFGRRIITRSIAPAEEVEKPPEEVKVAVPKERPPITEVIRRLRAAWPDLEKLLVTTLRSLRFEYLECDLTLGFSDPATTGEVYGWFWALKGLLSPAERVRLQMNPSFDEQVIEGTTSLCIAVQKPLLILLAVLGALVKRPVRDLIRLGA